MRWPNSTTADPPDFHYQHRQPSGVWAADLLATIPDDVLTAECRRRGLEVRR